MKMPCVWGQGQLFAFSALDGEVHCADDLVGILSADRIGIRFFTKIKRELALTGGKLWDLVFGAVTSDYIAATVNRGAPMRIVFAAAHLVVGNTAAEMVPLVLCEGRVTTYSVDGAEVQDSGDGEYTALAAEGDRFAFAFGKSAAEAAALARQGLAIDIERAEAEKRAFYERYGWDDAQYGGLYGKCLSVMKSQLYSAGEGFSTVWSTPDRLPHKYLWLWDSVFHAVGHRHVNTQLAQDLILAIFDHQAADGFIPHMATPNGASDVTQPPVIAWGAVKVFEKSGDHAFLETVYQKNKAFLYWCRENRVKGAEGLYIWKTAGEEICRCAESGMDNSSRFDDVVNVEAIDFSCFMANETRQMRRMAEILDRPDEAAAFAAWHTALCAAVNQKLWDAADGFYFDFDYDRGRIHKVWSVASFLPLFAGVCDEARAAALAAQLQNPATFATAFPIPCVAKSDPTFGSDMWRGPVWINYNYMVIDGLREYGYTALADALRDRTVDVMKEWYEKTGTLYEFYGTENDRCPSQLKRKGEPIEPYNMQVRYQSIRDYGWSATLLCDWLNEKR